MRKNLDMSKGLIVAEAVMMGLAPRLGRNDAHDVVYAACRTVNEKGGTLADVLAACRKCRAGLDRKLIEKLTDPANYLGAAPQMVDRVVASSAAVTAPLGPGRGGCARNLFIFGFFDRIVRRKTMSRRIFAC